MRKIVESVNPPRAKCFARFWTTAINSDMDTKEELGTYIPRETGALQ